MSLFGSILQKLGFGKDNKVENNTATTANTAPQAETNAAPATTAEPIQVAAADTVAVVDVVQTLTDKAAANPQKLNWQTSIVDLLKLLDLDSSLTARKEMATELGCPAEKMNDSASMNIWLHKEVLKRIAANGGNIPENMFA